MGRAAMAAEVNFEKVNKLNAEVYHSTYDVLRLTKNDLSELQNRSSQSSRGRVRLCAHRTPEAVLQEMFIVLPGEGYVRPHKHVTKSESMLVLEGELDFVIYSDDGEIESIARMGTMSSGLPFYNSMQVGKYHTLFVRSKRLTFLEITSGPFDRSETEFAPWSPPDTDPEAAKQFVENLKGILGE